MTCEANENSKVPGPQDWRGVRQLRGVLAERVCWLCGEGDVLVDEDGRVDGWEVDHVVARADGGTAEDGLRLAHGSCNRRRGKKPADDELRKEIRRKRKLDRDRLGA